MRHCYWIVKYLLVLSTYIVSGVVFEDNRLYESSSCQLPDGKTGTCSVNCSSIVDPRNVISCGFKKSVPIICCLNPVVHYPNIEKVCADRMQTLREIRDRELEAGRQAELRRQEKEKACNERVKQETGKLRHRLFWDCLHELAEPPNPVPALFAAEINEHPHMAALGLVAEGGQIEWYCGGTLIHENFVVTAAHCLTNIGKPHIVRVSDIDLSSPTGNEFAVDYDVEAFYIPPDYEPPKYYSDICLLRVKRKPFFGPNINPLPACIWAEHGFPKNEVLIMGYGAPAFSRSHNEKLYQGNLIILNSVNCSESYESYDTLPNGIISSQLCAYDPNGVMDTCEGDSGGPMQFNANDDFKTPYLLGITSFGVLCLDGNPGVYTRIHSFLSWIENIIST